VEVDGGQAADGCWLRAPAALAALAALAA